MTDLRGSDDVKNILKIIGKLMEIEIGIESRSDYKIDTIDTKSFSPRLKTTGLTPLGIAIRYNSNLLLRKLFEKLPESIIDEIIQHGEVINDRLLLLLLLLLLLMLLINNLKTERKI